MNDAQTLARARATYDASCRQTMTQLSEVLPHASAEWDDSRDGNGTSQDDVDRARRRLWAKIPAAYRAKQSELARRIPSPELVQAAIAWDWGSPCLLVCGPADCGKSTAAALILLRLMSKGRESEFRKWHSIQWFGANVLMNAAREWGLGEGACPAIRVASACRLLVLDELGNEQEWQTAMFDMLQARFERNLANIVLTPLQPTELHRRYGDSIVKRLVQRDGKLGTIVDCWKAGSSGG